MSSAVLRPTGTVATTQDRRRRRAEDLASITGAAAIIVGGAALLGWRFGAGTFEALIPGLVMLYGVLAIVIWMSARNARVMEESRRVALEELDRFFDDSSDLLATATAGGYFVRINPAWTTALGYDVAELRSRPIIDFVHPADVEATNRELHPTGQGGPDGRQFPEPLQTSGRFVSVARMELVAVRRPSLGLRRRAGRHRPEAGRRGTPSAGASARASPGRRTDAHPDDHRYQHVHAHVPADHRPFDRRAVGFEALTRFADGSPTAETFAAALECGLGRRPRKGCIGRGCAREADRLPGGTWLA